MRRAAALGEGEEAVVEPHTERVQVAGDGLADAERLSGHTADPALRREHVEQLVEALRVDRLRAFAEMCSVAAVRYAIGEAREDVVYRDSDDFSFVVESCGIAN